MRTNMANGISPDGTDLSGLEELWRIKLQDARERYFNAAAELHRTLLGNRGQPASAFCATGKRRAEAEAFAEYCRVLATFTELATNRKLPPPERSNVLIMPA